MPEIVAHYATNKDLAALTPIYESLLVSYLDDVEKYAHGNSQIEYWFGFFTWRCLFCNYLFDSSKPVAECSVSLQTPIQIKRFLLYINGFAKWNDDWSDKIVALL